MKADHAVGRQAGPATTQAGPVTTTASSCAKAVREIRFDGALGQTTFDENGQTRLPVELELRTVKNGVWVAY